MANRNKGAAPKVLMPERGSRKKDVLVRYFAKSMKNGIDALRKKMERSMSKRLRVMGYPGLEVEINMDVQGEWTMAPTPKPRKAP